MATPRTVAFHTLGCKLNYSETSALSRLFESSGYLPVKFEDGADIYVLNTCSVTEQADKECKKIVRQALRRQPGSFVVPEDIDEDYARQLVSEARVVDGASGKPQWVQKSRANHYLDCEALAMAIGYSLNVQRIPDGVVREGSDTGAEMLDGGYVEPAPAQTAAVMASAAMPDLRSRFAGLSSRLNR